MHNINIQPQEIDTVIYHKNCVDGFGAAWAAYKLLGNKASYIPAQYDDIDFVNFLKNKTIAVLDFSFSEEIIQKILSNNNRICIIDHHKTAKRIKHLDNIHLDETHSGAVLAWNYFHPTKSPPMFLRYIEDRDIWKWELENSREFSIYFQNVPKNFDSYSLYENQQYLEQAIEKGKSLNSYQFDLIRRISSNFFLTQYKDYKIKLVNSPILQSEIGNYLADDKYISAIWYKKYSVNKTIVSLRSKGEIDVSLLAQEFQGGGHKNAAGFSLDLDVDVKKLFTQTKS